MIEQTFALSDIASVFILIFLEILLSADNAVVLGVISRTLPQHLRNRALFIGLASSFILRAAALLLVSSLLHYTWVQLLGAAYLIYLSIRYFLRKNKSTHLPQTCSFWKTVLMIETFDILFALDSIVAGVAFINSRPSKLWIVYLGGMIGLIGMRYAAALFSQIIDRFPRLETSAYLLIGWIGIKLALSPPHPLFWTVTALLFLLGFFKPRR